MSRISSQIAAAQAVKRKLLIPYLVAGDPNFDLTLKLMHQLVADGADIIELGMAFSDPSSDGPVIQQGAERALANGSSLNKVLDLVAQFRQSDNATPIVLMGYLNPVEIMGYEKFVARAKVCGVDGVLLVDMPPSESTQLHKMLRESEIDTIYLVAPTTSDARAKSIVAHSSGYLYYVSLKGVTGAAFTDYASVSASIDKLRKLTELPIVVGFGIKDPQSAAAMAVNADGVVIGSALVSEIAKIPTGTGVDDFHPQATTAMIALVRKKLDTLN
jgi:tryptophan synthase alpha chain